MTLDLHAIYEGGTPHPWLEDLQADPVEAVDRLLLGGARLGTLAAADPAEVLLPWLRGIDQRGGFRGALDAALSGWIVRTWGSYDAPGAGVTALVHAWCEVGRVVATGGLPESARALRERLVADEVYLAALVEGRSHDPVAEAWAAVARHQEDGGLAHRWWRFCALGPSEPLWRASVGILGLRGLPHGGGFPETVLGGLVAVGRALNGRVREGWLDQQEAVNEFQRLVRVTMAAYPIAGWEQRWADATASAPGRPAAFPPAWLSGIVSLVPPRPASSPKHEFPARAMRIAARLEREGAAAYPEADRLIEDALGHLRATGVTEYVAKSACNFASRVMHQDPGKARGWLDLAREVDPTHAHGWSQTVEVLIGEDRLPEAVALATETVQRFPENVVVRNELAKVLWLHGRYDLAEQVNRETIVVFPEDSMAWRGLGEVLLSDHRYPEALEAWEAYRLQFGHAAAYVGKGRALEALGRTFEARDAYRAAHNADDPEGGRFWAAAWGRLAAMDESKGNLDSALQAYKSALERDRENRFARLALAGVLARQEKWVEAREHYTRVVERHPKDKLARKGLELVAKKAANELADAAVEDAIDEIGRLAQAEQSARDHLGRELPEVSAAPARPAPQPPAQPENLPAVEEAGPPVVVAPEPTRVAPVEATDPAPAPAPVEVLGLRRPDLAALLGDAALLHRWAVSTGTHRNETLASRRSRLVPFLAHLTVKPEGDPRVAGVIGLLRLDIDDVEPAVQFLRLARRRFPGSARVAFAATQAERLLLEVGAASANLRSALLAAGAIDRLHPTLRPVRQLSEVRARVAAGQPEDEIRSALGRLAWSLGAGPQVQRAPYDRAWGDAIRLHVFGEQPPREAKEIAGTEPIVARIRAAGPRLDDLCAENVNRVAIA